ncbi:MAG: glycine cleavage system aminomethyltransferase GcvT [Alphaproteobacteria bacterium]|nr:glycine cleavage system aminomethyltransferase GcvT [Alphaproteobacteria bacterium]
MERTALFEAHQQAHAKLVEFAGYEMPIHYPDGILKEHQWVRSHVGLFDVSHMGQAWLSGKTSTEFLEKITPSNFQKLPALKAKYTVLTNDQGGIIDDLIITRVDTENFYIVINAGCKHKDLAWLQQNLPADCTLKPLNDRSLIAIQGPQAEDLLATFFDNPDLRQQTYMTFNQLTWQQQTLFITRTGYTGEDGFEISVPNTIASSLWTQLLKDERAKPIGLGARDSLRLEMGYPLYGHDIDDTTSPIEAGLSWIVSKQALHCFGSSTIAGQQTQGTKRLRVAIILKDKGIAREGSPILSSEQKPIGLLTSGGFSPTLQAGIGQGYVESSFSNPGTPVFVEVRGRAIPAEITQFPFVAAKTKKAA